MDFKRYMDKTVRELDREVKEILKHQLRLAGKTDQKLIPLMKAFVRSCQGGKRIRGALVKLGYEIVARLPGVKARTLGGEIIKIGAAYEICHTAILIHDDIIDQSLMRRDQPSLYQVLGGNHYGISQAISLADYGFFLGYRIISEADFPEADKIKALELISKVLTKTAWGELLDLEDSDPLTVMKLKTACYTIAGPLKIGAVLAGAGEKLLGQLGLFGESLGIAYQIRDDILDSETKSVEEAEEYKNKAMKILPKITKDKNMSKLLEQMAEYLVQRTK